MNIGCHWKAIPEPIQHGGSHAHTDTKYNNGLVIQGIVKRKYNPGLCYEMYLSMMLAADSNCTTINTNSVPWQTHTAGTNPIMAISPLAIKPRQFSVRPNGRHAPLTRPVLTSDTGHETAPSLFIYYQCYNLFITRQQSSLPFNLHIKNSDFLQDMRLRLVNTPYCPIKILLGSQWTIGPIAVESEPFESCFPRRIDLIQG